MAASSGRVILAAMQGLARIDVSRVSRVDYEIDNILYSPGLGSAVDVRLALTRNALHPSTSGPRKPVRPSQGYFRLWTSTKSGLLLGLGPGGPICSFTINSGQASSATDLNCNVF